MVEVVGLDLDTEEYNCIILMSRWVGFRGKPQSRKRVEYVLYLFACQYNLRFESVEGYNLRP